MQPLYESLHCYVRGELNQKYGDNVVAEQGPIPAHLLGNMWAQQWGNVYNTVAPDNADPGYDVTELLAQHGYDEIKMVQQAEQFSHRLVLNHYLKLSGNVRCLCNLKTEMSSVTRQLGTWII